MPSYLNCIIELRGGHSSTVATFSHIKHSEEGWIRFYLYDVVALVVPKICLLSLSYFMCIWNNMFRNWWLMIWVMGIFYVMCKICFCLFGVWRHCPKTFFSLFHICSSVLLIFPNVCRTAWTLVMCQNRKLLKVLIQTWRASSRGKPVGLQLVPLIQALKFLTASASDRKIDVEGEREWLPS